jgi:hypothetical protein
MQFFMSGVVVRKEKAVCIQCLDGTWNSNMTQPQVRVFSIWKWMTSMYIFASFNRLQFWANRSFLYGFSTHVHMYNLMPYARGRNWKENCSPSLNIVGSNPRQGVRLQFCRIAVFFLDSADMYVCYICMCILIPVHTLTCVCSATFPRNLALTHATIFGDRISSEKKSSPSDDFKV